MYFMLLVNSNRSLFLTCHAATHFIKVIFRSSHRCKTYLNKKSKGALKKPQHVSLFKHRYICSRKKHKAYLEIQLMLLRNKKLYTRDG